MNGLILLILTVAVCYLAVSNALAEYLEGLDLEQA